MIEINLFHIQKRGEWVLAVHEEKDTPESKGGQSDGNLSMRVTPTTPSPTWVECHLIAKMCIFRVASSHRKVVVNIVLYPFIQK